jgi:hypothetical protein
MGYSFRQCVISLRQVGEPRPCRNLSDGESESLRPVLPAVFQGIRIGVGHIGCRPVRVEGQEEFFFKRIPEVLRERIFMNEAADVHVVPN